MLAKLLDYVHPDHEKYPKFLVQLNSYLSKAEVKKAKTDVSAAFDGLEETGHLAIGKYDKLMELMKSVDERIVSIIEEYKEKITKNSEDNNSDPDCCDDLSKASIREPLCVLFDVVAGRMPNDTSELGTLLGLQRPEVERIIEENQAMPLEQNFQVLWRWYNQTTRKDDHMSKLEEVLKEMGRNDVIAELKIFSRSRFSYECEKDGDKVLTERDCLFASQRITRDAYKLMRFLDMTQSNIEHIKMDFQRNIKEQTLRLFIAWRSQAYPNCTRDRLCSGLKYINRDDIIHELEEKWKQS